MQKIIFIIILQILAFTAQAKQTRSYHAIKQSKLEHPRPANGRYKGRCPKHVIDYIKPLACDGLDTLRICSGRL